MISSEENDLFGQNPLTLYEKFERIGNGTFGIVYKAMNKKTKEIVALKKIMLETENEGIPSSALREISLLREITHENVIFLKDLVIEKKNIYLVIECLEQDLKSKLKSLPEDKFLKPLEIKHLLYQLLNGLAAIHSKRIMHRDLKPQNILLDSKLNLKITDFGLARTFTIPIRSYTHEVVTLWYRAPEILLGSYEYSTPIDIWSIGCIFVEMATKKALFPGDSEIDQIFRIFRILGTPNEENWPGVTSLKDFKKSFPIWKNQNISDLFNSNLNMEEKGIDLLMKMLRFNPDERISAKNALEHPYFNEIIDKNK